MNKHLILEEAKNLVEQVEDSKHKLQLLVRENVMLKKILMEKNKHVLDQQEKIEELTRLLVLSDKMLKEMKEKIYNKEEKAERLSNKLREITGKRQEYLGEIKNIVDSREEQIKNLSIEKEEVQKKLVALMNVYGKTKNKLSEVSLQLNRTIQRIPSEEDKQVLDELKSKVKMKDAQMQKLAAIFYESQNKIKSFEDINKRLSIKAEQEKEVLSRILTKREEEIKNLREFAKKLTPPTPKKETKKVKVTVHVPKTFDPFERKELESMIKTALDHGDSVEQIKESLLSSGYEKEKIEEIIRKN